ncbi:MAG: D-2-hydroxyacid dehydrogenase [Chloroflexi bacterium]|nr:D-2-hydroxyacid dehydrogenase [Chloroflexota bacterium]
MTNRTRSILALSEHMAETYAGALRAAAPRARVITHAPDATWAGNPEEATVAYLSSDMWRTRMARDVLVKVAGWPMIDWFHTSSAGVDHPSFGRLIERGVAVTNAAGVNGGVIAQHVLALMLGHARRLDRYRVFQNEVRWERLECEELAGATVLIAGLGGIGSAVARLCKAFEMQVIGVRRSADVPVPNVDRLASPQQFRDALPEADFVVLACPLTEATRGMIDDGALAVMKPSAYLVNVARGPVVDAAALDGALREGRIGGAALDVFDREPLPTESPLWTCPNLTITPHSAGSSPANPERNARFFIENLGRYVRGEPLVNVVTSLD